MERKSSKYPKHIRKVTIRDTILYPYEIDVTARCYELIKLMPSSKTPGKVNRSVISFHGSLGQALAKVISLRVAEFDADLDGKVVTLRQYVDNEIIRADKMQAFWKYFAQYKEVDESLYSLKMDDVNRLMEISHKLP